MGLCVSILWPTTALYADTLALLKLFAPPPKLQTEPLPLVVTVHSTPCSLQPLSLLYSKCSESVPYSGHGTRELLHVPQDCQEMTYTNSTRFFQSKFDTNI